MTYNLHQLAGKVNFHHVNLGKKLVRGEIQAKRKGFGYGHVAWQIPESSLEDFVSKRLYVSEGDDFKKIFNEFLNEPKWSVANDLVRNDKEKHFLNRRLNAGFFSYLNLARSGGERNKYRFSSSISSKIRKALAEKRKFWQGQIVYANSVASNLGYKSIEEMVEHLPQRYIRPSADPAFEFYLTQKAYQKLLAPVLRKKEQQNQEQRQAEIKRQSEFKTTSDYRGKFSLTRAGAWEAFRRIYEYQQVLKKIGFELPEKTEIIKHNKRMYMPNLLYQKLVNFKSRKKIHDVNSWLRANSQSNHS